MTTHIVFIYPALSFSVVACVVADRGNRKFILLLPNLLQALVLFTIPVAWALHSLTMGQIYWVTFLNSTLAVWYNAANQSVVPTLLPTHLIHPANTVLQLGNSIGSLVGTPLGGILLTIMSGPWVLTLDAVSYLMASASILFVFAPLQTDVTTFITWRTVWSGMCVVWGDSLFRTNLLLVMMANFANFTVFSILVYHAREELHLSAPVTSIILGAWGLGLLLGSAVSQFLTNRVRSGTLMLVGRGLSVLPPLLYLVTASPLGMMIGTTLTGVGMSIWNIQSISMRQIHIPERVRGRAAAANKMFAWAAIPLGSLVGGTLVHVGGSSYAFLLAVAVQLGTMVLLFLSPLGKLGVRASLPPKYVVRAVKF